jgi:hypothetical protein
MFIDLEHAPMTIMTIRIPDDVKEAFDKAFDGEDKDAVIADLIRHALREKAEAQVAKDAPKRNLVAEFRKLRESMPAISQDEIRRLREEGRH